MGQVTSVLLGGELNVRGPSEGKIRILIVDDNSGDVHLLRLALDDAQVDCELTVIDDGAEMLAFVRQSSEHMGGRIQS